MTKEQMAEAIVDAERMLRGWSAQALRWSQLGNAARIAMAFLELRRSVADHHAQKADDRCIEDDDRLYAAAGLPPCDRRVGDKAAMLANCARFIDRRCEAGAWPTYVQLETRLELARRALDFLVGGQPPFECEHGVAIGKPCCRSCKANVVRLALRAMEA